MRRTKKATSKPDTTSSRLQSSKVSLPYPPR